MSVSRILLCFAFIGIPCMGQTEPLWWGQGEFELGQTRYSNRTGNANSIFETSPTSARLSGKIGAAFGPYGLQFDLNASADDVPSDEYTGYTAGTFAAVHASYDISPKLTLGVFGGAGRSSTADWYSAELNFFGLEGRYDFGGWMMTASYGRLDSVDESETDAFHDGEFLRVGALAEIGPGVIEGSVSVFEGQQDSSTSYPMDGYAVALKYSQGFANAPLAWSVGLESDHFANYDGGTDNGSFDSARLTIGLTAWFGSDTVSQSKRRAFDTVDFGRVVHAGYFLD